MSKICNNCSKCDSVSIPYVAYQATAVRQERQIKRMWVALIVSIALMFFTNMIWVGVFSSYDYSSEEVIIEADQDGRGINIVGGGNIGYGAESQNIDPQEKAG